MFKIIQFLLLFVGGLVVQCLDCIANSANISLQLADQSHDFPRVAENLHTLSVRIVSQAKGPLDGGTELAHLYLGIIKAIGGEVCLLKSCNYGCRLAGYNRIERNDVRVARDRVLQLGDG